MGGWLAALLCLCLVLAACAAPGPGVQPDSPLSPLWAVSPLPTRAGASRVHLPIVEGVGFTQHCVALDTWAGSVAGQLATLPEGGCGHIWWTPNPLPDGLWPACRSVAECEALNVDNIRRSRPGAVVLLLNEPNNSDISGGGWPVAPATAARRLAVVVERLKAAGLKAACCGLFLDARDTLGAAAWWRAYVAAGGQSDLRHYHVFGRSASDAAAARALAEKVMPAPWIISESGWNCAVSGYVQGIESPRYRAVFTLKSAGRCK